MSKVITLVFDGNVFVPSEPIELRPGTRLTVTVNLPPSPEELAEANRILRGDGTPLPWETADEAIGYARARPGYHLFPESPDEEESCDEGAP